MHEISIAFLSILFALAVPSQAVNLRHTHRRLQSKPGVLSSNVNVSNHTKQGVSDGSKLVINSNAKYDIARQKLFTSLLESWFTRFSDVIVVLGGAQADSAPYRPEDELGKHGVVYIDTKLESFEYHGFSAMFHHREHPWIKADRYMFVHDTVIVRYPFPHVFKAHSFVAYDEVYHPPIPFSNICVIGGGVVAKWQTNFDYPVNKAEGVQLEFGAGVMSGTNFVQPLLSFAGKSTVAPARVDTHKNVDLYHTGHPRRAIDYPAFALTKYILVNQLGDLAPGPARPTYGLMAALSMSNLSAVDIALGP